MIQSNPLNSLKQGSWFKLICGASYQHLPMVRNLALAYSLSGADCIDVAADPAVIKAAQAGLQAAQEFSGNQSPPPWLMVSINDGEDPHFRKASFDATHCPQDCPQPCLNICPADAISLPSPGVIQAHCYGCGRCVPICPQELIFTKSHLAPLTEVVQWFSDFRVDALEIHTQVGHYEQFTAAWQVILPRISQLKLLAISCPDAPGILDYLRSLWDLIKPLPCPLIWQTDGRSMSGDIGKGTTHAALALAQKVLATDLPGYIQLAGGTNDYTVAKLNQSQMLHHSTSRGLKSVAGVGYGSYARSLLLPIFDKLEITVPQGVSVNHHHASSVGSKQPNLKLEQNPELLEQAIATASGLVNQLKGFSG